MGEMPCDNNKPPHLSAISFQPYNAPEFSQFATLISHVILLNGRRVLINCLYEQTSHKGFCLTC